MEIDKLMFLGWTNFVVLQLVVIILFIWKRKDHEDFILNNIFPTKLHFLICNICVLAACYLCNTERQLFCRPVTWASTLLILFFTAFLIIPFVRNKPLLMSVISAICGMGLFIVLYILLFAGGEYQVFIILISPEILVIFFFVLFIKRKFRTNVFDAFLLYPAVILSPFLFIYQLIVYLKDLKKKQKLILIASSCLTLLTFLILTYQIHVILKKIDKVSDKEKVLQEIIKNPVNNYLTELILGAHWKYHTELEVTYDGWRPPYHDPVLGFSKKILFFGGFFGEGTGTRFYYVADLTKQPLMPGVDTIGTKELYEKLYPDNPTSFDCKCAKHERLLGPDYLDKY
jgi:hypothetical protein